jgi:hypothetical protein
MASNRNAERKRQARLAEKWNAENSSRTPVVVLRDGGCEVQTCTRSYAWLVGDTAVVLLDGMTGGFRLDRCKAVRIPERELPVSPTERERVASAVWWLATFIRHTAELGVRHVN